jgi:hypothetical protein
LKSPKDDCRCACFSFQFCHVFTSHVCSMCSGVGVCLARLTLISPYGKRMCGEQELSGILLALLAQRASLQGCGAGGKGWRAVRALWAKSTLASRPVLDLWQVWSLPIRPGDEVGLAWLLSVISAATEVGPGCYEVLDCGQGPGRSQLQSPSVLSSTCSVPGVFWHSQMSWSPQPYKASALGLTYGGPTHAGHNTRVLWGLLEPPYWAGQVVREGGRAVGAMGPAPGPGL